MSYFVSAYRNHDDSQGYVVADMLPFPSLDDALAWADQNAFSAITEAGGVSYRTDVDARGVKQMVADADSQRGPKYIKYIDGIRTVIIQRADIAVSAAAEEAFENLHR